MVFSRQRLLLAVLDAHGGRLQAVEFQKLLMLYTLEWESSPSYEFVPYKFGGFSFTSCADKRKLASRGLLKDTESEWIITPQGRVVARAEPTIRDTCRRFSRKYSDLRGDDLVAEVYRRYPYYAARSEIAGRILKSERDRDAVARAKPTTGKAGLVTVGYEGKSLEAYLNQLIRDGVTLLCDVRRNPISRKYGFSKRTLDHACETVSIRYEHLPELGIPADERKSLQSQEDYDRLFRSYRGSVIPKQLETLKRIAGWVTEDGLRVALTCFELAPEQCHRQCVAQAVQRRIKREPVEHL